MHCRATFAEVCRSEYGADTFDRYRRCAIHFDKQPPRRKLMRQKGKIRSWNDEKGFGFIEPMTGEKDVFLHISACGQSSRRPEVGQIVTYEAGVDRQGRSRAAHVLLPGAKRRNRKNSRSVTFPLLAVGAFFIAAATMLAPVFLLAYVFVSALTFAVYGLDKSAARSGRGRTSEHTLHCLAFLGGWPGAVLAQRFFRHKSKKSSFRVTFWVTVIFNILIVLWLSTIEINLSGQAWIKPA